MVASQGMDVDVIDLEMKAKAVIIIHPVIINSQRNHLVMIHTHLIIKIVHIMKIYDLQIRMHTLNGIIDL